MPQVKGDRKGSLHFDSAEEVRPLSGGLAVQPGFICAD